MAPVLSQAPFGGVTGSGAAVGTEAAGGAAAGDVASGTTAAASPGLRAGPGSMILRTPKNEPRASSTTRTPPTDHRSVPDARRAGARVSRRGCAAGAGALGGG